MCGRGTCAVSPECTRECWYREADRALRSHYDSRHTQRQAMPGEQPDHPYGDPIDSDENGRIEYVDRRMERWVLGGVLFIFLCAIAAPYVTAAIVAAHR